MLTVILATRDRACLLARTLEAMSRLREPEGGWRLVAADDGSTDETAEILDRWRGVLPLTVVPGGGRGMGAALNAAVDHVRGDLVVKADDDILPSPGWLVAYRDAADLHPEAALFGGVTEPEWPGPPPPWLWTDRRALGLLFALTSPPDGPCGPREVYGPHWAVRASVFEGGARLNRDVGPDASKPVYAMGVESELFARLEVQGRRARHVTAARAAHIVRPEQFSEAWILKRAFSCGLGAARLGRGGRRPVRLLAYGAAARAMRGWPPSRLRTRVMVTERLLAGMAAADAPYSRHVGPPVAERLLRSR